MAEVLINPKPYCKDLKKIRTLARSAKELVEEVLDRVVDMNGQLSGVAGLLGIISDEAKHLRKKLRKARPSPQGGQETA